MSETDLLELAHKVRRLEDRQQLAELIVHVPDLPDARIPLMAEADVAPGGFAKRLTTAAEVLMKRYLDQPEADPAPAS